MVLAKRVDNLAVSLVWRVAVVVAVLAEILSPAVISSILRASAVMTFLMNSLRHVLVWSANTVGIGDRSTLGGFVPIDFWHITAERFGKTLTSLDVTEQI
jgi:hypothetical protein